MMDSDGTLATVTYLPGVTPPHEIAQHRAVVPEPELVPSESAVPFAIDAESEPASEPASVPASVPPSELASEPASERSLRRAENVSLNALTRRGRSRWELGEILSARDLDPSVIEAELDRLERVGLIDDEALADTIVRTQHERKGLGRAALINEMRRKRIDQTAIDTALEQIGDDDEFQRAVQLAERRVNQLERLDHDTAVRRLSGYLQRKGYSGDTVRRVTLEVLPRRSSGVRFS